MDLATKTTRISDFEDTFPGLAVFECAADHDFFNISVWIMDFVCFEVRIAEINLAVCFNFFCLT